MTLDPFIVYTSNLFAIMSLRSLYGFVSTMMSELRFLVGGRMGGWGKGRGSLQVGGLWVGCNLLHFAWVWS